MEQEIRNKYPNLYGKGTGIGAKVGHIIDGYGWLNSIYDVALDGIFSKAWKESPVESVENATLWEVITYMSWKTAQSEYKQAYQDLAQKAHKQKG